MNIKIISSNIRFDNPKDGKNSWSHRREFLSEILLNFCPHIIGTQEGRQPQILELKELLKNYSLVDTHREWISERMYPCIFVRDKSIEVEASGDIWLSETPSIAGSVSFKSQFPRLCTWFKGRYKKKHEILFANLHLDHLQSETRLAQINVFAEEIKKIRENQILIISGDFNDGPKSQVRQFLLQKLNFLQDPWLQLKKMEQPSYHKFDGPQYKKERERIDWILVDRQLRPLDINFDNSSKGALWPSDHFPLKAEFIMPSFMGKRST